VQKITENVTKTNFSSQMPYARDAKSRLHIQRLSIIISNRRRREGGTMSEQANASETRNGETQKQKKRDSDYPDAGKHKNGARGLDFNVGEPKSIKPFLMLVTMSVIALIVLVLILYKMN
jgi:hypothetical protein